MACCISLNLCVFHAAFESPLFRRQARLFVQSLMYPNALSHTEAHPLYPQPFVEWTMLPPNFGLGIRGSERLSDLPKAAQLTGGRVRAETPSPSLDRAPVGVNRWGLPEPAHPAVRIGETEAEERAGLLRKPLWGVWGGA